MDIQIDTTLTAEAAVRDYQLAKQKLAQALSTEAMACGDSEYAAAKAQSADARSEEVRARVNAQYAVKRATGLFPYELALMGL